MLHPVHAAIALAVSAVACSTGSSSFYGDMPLHWRGSIPTCKVPRVTSGEAFRVLDTGYLEAVAVGRSTLTCADGTTTDVGVQPIARLAIEGPTTASRHGDARYALHAFAADDHELRFGDLDDNPPSLIEWTTSDGIIGKPERNHGFGGNSPAYARLGVPETGPVTIGARFGDARVTLVIDVK